MTHLLLRFSRFDFIVLTPDLRRMHGRTVGGVLKTVEPRYRTAGDFVSEFEMDALQER